MPRRAFLAALALSALACAGDSPTPAEPGGGTPPTGTPPTGTPSTPGGSDTRWLTGYYVGYQRDLYPEATVDFTHLTHVVVGAVQPTSAGGLDTTFYIDNRNGPAMARALAARAHQFDRKAILMLGGAGSHDALVSATSTARRARFVADLVRVVNAFGYDGIDLDWEPVAAADKPIILQLIQELRAAKPGLVVTFPIEWVNMNFGADPWYAQLAAVVDQMNVMSYDMAGNWGGWVSWHTSALYGEAGNHPSSVSGVVSAYRRVGVPAAKLGIGVGAYGNCWQGVTAMLQPLDGTPANVVASDNEMGYANIVRGYFAESAYRWDATARMSYLAFAAPSGARRCSLVSYDDPRSLAEKGAYVKAQALGGAIMWTINQQHFPAAPAGERDPLMKAIGASMQ